MFRKKEDFIQMLKMEMEDLIEDLNLLLKRVVARHENSEISDYVYRENSAFFEGEILGTKNCLQEIDTAASGSWESPGAMVDSIKACMKKRIKEYAYPPALSGVIERKIDKVAEYLYGNGPE